MKSRFSHMNQRLTWLSKEFSMIVGRTSNINVDGVCDVLDRYANSLDSHSVIGRTDDAQELFFNAHFLCLRAHNLAEFFGLIAEHSSNLVDSAERILAEESVQAILDTWDPSEQQLLVDKVAAMLDSGLINTDDSNTSF